MLGVGVLSRSTDGAPPRALHAELPAKHAASGAHGRRSVWDKLCDDEKRMPVVDGKSCRYDQVKHPRGHRPPGRRRNGPSPPEGGAERNRVGHEDAPRCDRDSAWISVEQASLLALISNRLRSRRPVLARRQESRLLETQLSSRAYTASPNWR